MTSISTSTSTTPPKMNLNEHSFEILYMNARARAEMPRLLLEFVGAKYTSRVPTDWKQTERQLTPFGRMPVLTHFKPDGSKTVVPETGAFTRYLAKLFDLGGDSLEDDTLVDVVYSSAVDNVFLVVYEELWTKPNPKDPKTIDQCFQSLTRIFSGFEDYLVANGSNGYLLKEKTTYADFAIYDWLNFFYEDYPEQAAKLVSNSVCPAVFKLYRRLDNLPAIRAYIDGGRCSFRPSSPIMGVYSASLMAKDGNTSFDFYTKTLGLECRLDKAMPGNHGRYMEFVASGANATCISIFAPTDLSVWQLSNNAVALKVANVQKAYDELVKRGVTFTMPPSWCAKGPMAQFQDDSGNLIMLTATHKPEGRLLMKEADKKYSTSTPILGVYSVAVHSTNWEESLKFYEKLGFHCVMNVNPMNQTTAHSAMRYLEFAASGSNGTILGVFCSGDSTSFVKSQHQIAFKVHSVAKAHEELVKLGAVFTMPVTDCWKGPMAKFDDNCGNSLTITGEYLGEQK